ncbi:MAG: recombinase family protein [Rhodospirillaceae bacterium]
MEPKKAVAYYRVSTQKQNFSGLGLAGQHTAVEAYLKANDLDLVASLTEIESGKVNDRPKLAEAVALAKRNKAVLVIAKLDRLARSVATISGLMESGVEFVAADMPFANRLTIHLLAAVAEYERDQISARTKAALQAAKGRGQVLGNRTNLPEASALGRQRLVDMADEHAARVFPMLQHVIKAENITSVHRAADALNERRIPTARGGTWFGSTVWALIKRCGYTGLADLRLRAA